MGMGKDDVIHCIDLNTHTIECILLIVSATGTESGFMQRMSSFSRGVVSVVPGIPPVSCVDPTSYARRFMTMIRSWVAQTKPMFV